MPKALYEAFSEFLKGNKYRNTLGTAISFLQLKVMGILNKGIFGMFDSSDWQWVALASFYSVFHRQARTLFWPQNVTWLPIFCCAEMTRQRAATPIAYSMDFIL